MLLGRKQKEGTTLLWLPTPDDAPAQQHHFCKLSPVVFQLRMGSQPGGVM